MHWRNNFLWVLTCHNLFKCLRVLRQFLIPPGLFAPKNPFHTTLSTTSAASLLVILGILSASDPSVWSCPTRGNLELLGQSVFSYDSLLNKLQMCEKQKGSFIFQGALFPLLSIWCEKKENLPTHGFFLFSWAPLRHSLDINKEWGEGKLMDLGNTNRPESDYSHLDLMVQLWYIPVENHNIWLDFHWNIHSFRD